jgi:hemolysin-activating ACP:hemolysin acyltransferase
MDSTRPHVDTRRAEFPKTLDRTQIGAGTFKLISASVGDVAMVFSRSPAHKHFSLADIEWVILPAVVHGQFHVAETANTEFGFRAPIAVVTGALVSEEVDQRLRGEGPRRARLRPDEWKTGDIGWIIDLAGDQRGLAVAIDWLKAGPFKGKTANIAARDATGAALVLKIEDWFAPSKTQGDAT